jgi:hypothetical protein
VNSKSTDWADEHDREAGGVRRDRFPRDSLGSGSTPVLSSSGGSDLDGIDSHGEDGGDGEKTSEHFCLVI